MKYIGVTSSGYQKRYAKHLSSAECGSTAPIHCAIREYGKANFELVLLETNVAKLNAGSREQYYIKLYNTKEHGYNQTHGGGGNLLYEYTDEVKDKMRNALKQRKYTAERNNKIRQAMLGRDYKPEWKVALSQARMGRFTGADNPFYGHHHTDTTKSKLHDANSKYIVYQYDIKTNALIQTFDCAMSAARWVVERGISKAKVETCNGRILYVCKHADTCTAYGFIWKLKEKCID